MSDDFTDKLLAKWDSARPDIDVGSLQVTARLARIGRTSHDGKRPCSPGSG
jgi:hypothetical protein